MSSPTRCSSSSVPARRGLHLLEAVRQVERVRVEERELLLDRDREVRRVLELLARERDLLVRREPLLVAHGGSNLVEALSAV